MMTIYVVLRSNVHADRCVFNTTESMGGYLSRERAEEKMMGLVSEEKACLEIPFDPADYREEYTPDHWEAWQDGYAAGWFVRYEIVPVKCEVTP